MDFYARKNMLKKFMHLSKDKQLKLINGFNTISKLPLALKEINPKNILKNTPQYEFAGYISLLKIKK
ncbi:MAG TPA: hypothetical protein QF753_14030 [Victivallales bacterium]|nr:hypothetical protein [Victivallales bacterium]